MKLILKLGGILLSEGGLVPEQGRASMKPAKTDPKPGTTCPECFKNFLSEKSLYGHMRCHPGRSYQGIKTPYSAAKNSSSATILNADEWSDYDITAERPTAAPKLASARPRKNPIPAPRGPAYKRPAPFRRAIGSRLSLAQKDTMKADGLSSSKMTRAIDDVEDEEDYYSGDGYDYEDVYRKNLNRLSGLK